MSVSDQMSKYSFRVMVLFKSEVLPLKFPGGFFWCGEKRTAPKWVTTVLKKISAWMDTTTDSEVSAEESANTPIKATEVPMEKSATAYREVV